MFGPRIISLKVDMPRIIYFLSGTLCLNSGDILLQKCLVLILEAPQEDLVSCPHVWHSAVAVLERGLSNASAQQRSEHAGLPAVIATQASPCTSRTWWLKAGPYIVPKAVLALSQELRVRTQLLP